YDQCPRRWKHKYIDKLPDPPGPAAVLGTFAHAVLEKLYQESPEERTVERTRTLAGDVWKATETGNDFRSLSLDDAAQREFRWKAWTSIEGLWALEDPSQVAVDATEQRVTAQLAGVPFVGYLDRLDRSDQGLVVIDYKTGRPPRAAHRNKPLGQVLLYAAAVEAQTGEQPVEARLLYLGKEVLETDVSSDLLNVETERLAASWSQLEKDCMRDTFATRTGPLCGWCPYVTTCEDGEQEVRLRVDAGRVREDAPARKALGI
ncbi:MAG: PD-(D/E)XK nuclease family protein, partial [Actinomycetota bacterium]|nr:PD-(D/E)XK nuclease family protein [Actinomycetota bacterium]